MALLLTAGRADAQDALHETAAGVALRAETTLAPQHRAAQRPFGRIVGRFETRFTHERPQRVFVGEQLRTQSLRGIGPARPGHQQRMHARLDRRHGRLERRAVDLAVAIAMPERKHHLAQRQEVRAPDCRAAAAVDQRLKVAQEMTPAQLMAGGVDGQIGPVAIRGHDPSVVRPDQLPQRRSGAAGMEQEGRRCAGDHRPQPAAAATLLPASLIEVRAVLLLDNGPDGLIHRGEGGAADLLEIHPAAETDREAEEVGKQPPHGAVTQVLVAVEEGHGRRCARTERAGRHICGALGRHEAATAGAADGVIVVGGDERPNLRQLPCKLDLGCAGVRVPLGEAGLAVRTCGWEVVADGVDVVGIGGRPLVAGMPLLPARLPTARRPLRPRRGRRWVGRRGLGRVAGMLGEARFQVCHALLERGDLRERCLVLLLEILHHLHQGAHDRLDAGRRGLPVRFGDAQSLS